MVRWQTAGMDDGVTVIGVGEVAARPDVVVLALSVSCDGSDVSVALTAAAERTSAVADAARAAGVADRDIRSTGAQVHPLYADGGMAIAAYRSTHQARVTVRRADSVGDLVTACVAAAGNALSVDQISLEIDDTSGLEREARDAAYRDAHDKATQFARLAGKQLGPLVALHEGLHEGPESRSAPGPRMAAASLASSMPVQAGELTVRAVVTARWGLRA